MAKKTVMDCANMEELWDWYDERWYDSKLAYWHTINDVYEYHQSRNYNYLSSSEQDRINAAEYKLEKTRSGLTRAFNRRRKAFD